jgi:hypothetical protein
LDASVDHDSSNASSAEPDRDDSPSFDVIGDAVRERAGQRAGSDKRVDLREGHGGERIAGSGGQCFMKLLITL